MASLSLENKNGGRQMRICIEMHKDIKNIRKKILVNTDIEEISFEEITHFITHHKLWNAIVEDASNAKREEILMYGKRKR